MASASNEFKLIGPTDKQHYKPSAVTLSCRLSPEISAVNMEIRWFKETHCVCAYKNGQLTEGKGYEGRASLLTQELETGDISLQLRDCKRSDAGYYLCQVTDGDRALEITVEMNCFMWRVEEPDLLVNDIYVYQRDIEWTKEERMEMEKSALLTSVIELQGVSKSMRNKDKQLEDCKRQIENKDAELRNREKIMKEKDALLKDTNIKLEKTAKEVHKRERVLHQSGQHMKLKTTQIQETQIQVEKLEKRLVEKDKEQLKVLKKSFCETDVVLMGTNEKLQNTTEQIKEKISQLENMNKLLTEKATQLKNTDKELETSKNKLETLDQELQDKRRELQEMMILLEQQKTELEEKNKCLEEKESLLTERGKQLIERDTRLQEQVRCLTENTQTIQMKDKMLEEKDTLLREVKEELGKTYRKLEENQTQMKEKERQLENMVKELETSKHKLIERDKQLQERDKLLEEKTKQLHEQTDPELSVPIRKRDSKQLLPPIMSGEIQDSAAPVTRRNSMDGGRPTLSVPVPELRVVLLGRTGSGKSAAGNIILSRQERNQASTSTATSTATQQSESKQGEVAERRVSVVDTPDWFSSGLSLEKLREDVGHCVRLSAPGPHAFLLVIPVKQPTGDERGMLEKMEDIFGERCWRNTMIIFSVTDDLQKKNIEEFVKSGNQEVQKLVEKCGNMFHCINIKESGDGSQVSELLEKIEKMVKESREQFYSSEIYLETETQIRAMEIKILEERVEKRRQEEMKIKGKNEKEVQDSLRKIEGVIQEHEGNIRQLNDRTTDLERKMKKERDEEKKKELERELKREVERRTEMEQKVKKLKEKRERERREMEERHQQELDEIREEYEGQVKLETERNLMKIILPGLQRIILESKTKMQEEFSRQLEEKHRELETLKQKLSEVTELLRLREEVYQTTVMSVTYKNQQQV